MSPDSILYKSNAFNVNDPKIVVISQKSKSRKGLSTTQFINHNNELNHILNS